MASLVTRKSGLRFVQFVDGAGERRTVTLGSVALREATRIRDKIMELASARRAGIEPSAEAQLWLSRIGDDLHAKLMTVGLAQTRVKPKATTLGELVQTYIGSRTDWSSRTGNNFKQATDWLLEYFPAETDIVTITQADAEEFRRWLEPKLATATCNRHVKRANQLFSYAVRKRLIDKSPFAEVKGGTVGGNPDRQYFVTREEVAALFDACPDHEWQLLVALSRFGGLRIPSEATALRWADINWDRGRMVVPVPKLKHLPGHETRVVPIFPELKPYLERAFERAVDGAEYVIARHRGENLRTQIGRIIRRAGLKAWPKPWHAMRASRQTELARDFPLHVVCSWIGNSEAVAYEHYLTVTEQDFTKAVTCSALQNAQQYGAETNRTASHELQETAEICVSSDAEQAYQYPRQDSNLGPAV